MADCLGVEVVAFDTGVVNGTLAIGVSFIFIAYFLHPAVESAYHRVRAYRAWRQIEMRQAVEVTNYTMLAETLGGRGKWDTARVITVLLAIFSLVSWGLELSMDLADHNGDADILSLSPPIYTDGSSDGNTEWKVTSDDFISLKTDWESLSNVGEDSAKSKYNIIGNSTCRAGYVDGDIVVAFWSNSNESTKIQLHYLQGDCGVPTVTNISCTGDTQTDTFDIYNGEVHWGNGFECESGPAQQGCNLSDSPPTLVLNNTKGTGADEGDTTDGEVYLVVEESSNYPSFLYSVWTARTASDNSFKLNHEFHIAATMRLAEAVVTGIVHGQIRGRYCFELVRMYSENGPYTDNEDARAEPFGEHPTNETVRIEDMESIPCGVRIDQKAVIFFSCLFLLTTVGIVWSLCLRSSIGMDVYDRDELIRAISMSGVTGSCAAPSSIRIFVRKEDTGIMSVAITDTNDAGAGCARVFRLGGKVVEHTSPTPSAATATVEQYNRGYGGAAVPVGPRTVWLEGVQTGMGRALPGRNGNYRYPSSVSLSASPVPSNACSFVETPFHSPPPLGRVPRAVHGSVPREDRGFVPREGSGFILSKDCGFVPRESGGITGKRGMSVLFDDGYSPDDSEEDEKDDKRSGVSDDFEGGSTPNVDIAAPGAESIAAVRPRGEHPTLIEGSSWVDRSDEKGVLGFSSSSSTPEARAGTPSPPPFLVRREQTFGSPQLDSLEQESERELVGPNSSFNVPIKAND